MEFVDPLTNPEMEREANQIHGIRPTPLQVTDRGGVSLVNVYFDLLIAYGDQSASLNFSQLIDIVDTPLGAEVRLRNLEYDLTSAIQRVVYGFQSLEAILSALEQPAQLTLYLSSATVPEWMAEVSQTIADVTQEIAEANPDKVSFSVVDMSAADVAISEQELLDRYQIQPVATSFFATETFFLHLVIEAGQDIQVIYPAGELSQAEIRSAIESSLKRSSSGFLKVVGLWTPPPAGADQFGRQLPSLQQYSILEETLRETYELRRVTLEEGQLATDIDVLILLAPHGLSDVQRYALDQYIMRGGSVIAAAGHYRLGIDPYVGALQLDVNENGIAELLASYGIVVGESVVMDLQNALFPVQVQRDVGDMVVSEIQALNYPYFADVRADKLDPDNPVVNSLSLLTMSWASPVTIDEAALPDARISTLVRSSDNAWETTAANPEPDLQTYPDFGFPIGSEMRSIPLAVAVEASFESYFSGKPSPFDADAAASEDNAEATEPIGLIERSPDNTRLIVLGSAEFVNDTVYQISASFGGDRFLSNIQFIANAIDWFTEDVSLASIRSRGASARILPPVHEAAQNQWVLINYAVAIIGLVLIGVVWQMQRRAEQPIQLIPPMGAAAETPPANADSANETADSDQGGA